MSGARAATQAVANLLAAVVMGLHREGSSTQTLQTVVSMFEQLNAQNIEDPEARAILQTAVDVQRALIDKLPPKAG